MYIKFPGVSMKQNVIPHVKKFKIRKSGCRMEVKVKGRGKAHPITGQEGPDVE